MTRGYGTIGRGILAAYDGSPGSEVALEWAAAASQRRHLPLSVVYCIEMATVPLEPMYNAESLPREVREEAQAVLDRGVRLAEKVTESSLVTTAVLIGSPAAELVIASREVELVVIGSRGRGRVAAGLLGSASYTVVAHAKCPVVVVRGGTNVHPDATHPVVVGVDASDASQRALELATEAAVSAQAPLHIVTVGRLRSPEGWAYVENSAAGNEHTHATRERALPILDAARDRVLGLHPDLEIETEVLFGDAGHVLAQSGVHAGLVVLGSRGRGGFMGLLLGSVSHTVIHQAACPVMVVR